MYKVGDTVWFVAGQQEVCETCTQHKPDMQFTVAKAQVRQAYEEKSGTWPKVKDCSCVGERCLHMMREDFTAEPEVTSVYRYRIVSEEHGSLAYVNEAAISETKEEAQELADSPKAGCVVMIRPEPRRVLSDLEELPVATVADIPPV